MDYCRYNVISIWLNYIIFYMVKGLKRAICSSLFFHMVTVLLIESCLEEELQLQHAALKMDVSRCTCELQVKGELHACAV